MFDELHTQLDEEVTTAEPTLRTAAEAIRDGLSHFTTAKGVLRSRPISWAKKVARDHFGWSRIGSKKFESILEIGYSEYWFEKTDQGKLVGSSVPDRAAEQTNHAEMGSSDSSSSSSAPKDMGAFYRSGGALGNWKVLTEDDWDGKTYKIITKRICSWLEEGKVIEVPSWLYGQRVYELFEAKVREDKASGAERTYCTSCKSELPAGCVYPDSHGRFACSGCNDLLHPSLRKPAGWKPKGIKYESKPKKRIQKNESHSVKPKTKKKTKTKDPLLPTLGASIAKDGSADLMDAGTAIASSEL
tara:strand:- start:6782 stop:7684 length:903 start_codon:yes stop_codon:yes gene_type:complete